MTQTINEATNGANGGGFTAIPVIDLSPWRGSSEDRAALAETLREICHNVGFFIVTNHGIDRAVVDNTFAIADRFFNLPIEQKLLIDKRRSRHFRGWEPEGAEYTNNQPDIREQIDLWTEHPARAPDVTPHYYRLLGPNQWPPDDVLPGFRETLDRWFTDLGGLAGELMQILAMGLGLEPDHFERLFGEERMSLTKLINYPATPPGQFGVNAHHDAGFLTVLAPGKTPGLEVENAEGTWIPVPIIPDSFVINLGEILQAMTGNYFVATPHRVRTNAPRQSAGYFHGPSLDMPLAPLKLDRRFAEAVAASPRHANAGFMAQSDETEAGVAAMASPDHPDIYGDQLWNYFSRSYPDNVRRHYPAAVPG
ncbi:MAG: isopenicillin N synthase family oxygenase [Alphaproteobacteria bacterium]|nr:isopenicillin N synthase family oxygenase [Alphaproteobacteria bacterium]